MKIGRRGQVAPFLVSRERIESIIETFEIVSNPKAMKAIRAYEAGREEFKDAACLDEN